jgi:FixJ family two-component response regulator
MTAPALIPTVFVVDDDPALRTALDSLLRSVGMQVFTYASGAEFLQHSFDDAPACLILDVRLQGESGLDFQVRLTEQKVWMPIIFVSGHGDIAMSVKAMKAGALDFLVKPFRDQDLLDAVSMALQQDSKRRETGKSAANLQARYQTLTPREQEVMAFAVTGLMNKQIASEMGLSEITVKIHRGHAMKKMQAKTFADLVKMSQALAGS